MDVPKYSDECYSDPSVGMNPDMAYDCGKPRGWIKAVGWAGGEAKWPGAYKAVRNFTMDNDTMSALIVKVDLEGMSVEDTVAGWLEANQSTWAAWTK